MGPQALAEIVTVAGMAGGSKLTEKWQERSGIETGVINFLIPFVQAGKSANYVSVSCRLGGNI